jgi:hypothetical protein
MAFFSLSASVFEFFLGVVFFFFSFFGLFDKDMPRTEQSSELLVLELVKSDDVI